MKKALCYLFILVAFPMNAFAGQTGPLGVGIIIGEPFGPTINYWIEKKQSIDFGIGLGNDTIIYGDYLWHGWELNSQPEIGKVGFYTGIGLRYEDKEHTHHESGIRIPFGVNLLLNKAPIELFGEIVPVIQYSPDGQLNFDVGIGARFYFLGNR